MDFHTLSRRDLQALCKKNKIPANITNLAMADALQSLPNVEGLEELLMNPGTDFPETPAKSMTGTPSVTLTSKLTTRTRRTTRKAEGETDQAKIDIPKAAPPSACAKPSIARSTHRNVESSNAARVYTTRRSTRLLEKQMDQLSLKDNEDVVVANANMGKDMQRQFSEDMNNSDELDVTKEAVDEPESVEVPLQKLDVLLENEKSFSVGDKIDEPVNMDDVLDVEKECNEVEESIKDEECNEVPLQKLDVLLENEKSFSVGDKIDEPVNMDDALDVEKECNEVEESIKDEECKDDEEEPMQEDVAEQIEMVSHPETISENVIAVEADIPITENVIAVEAVIPISSVVLPDEIQMVIEEEEVINVNGEETLESEADDSSAIPDVDPQTTKLEENVVQLKEFSDGEFDFLSESDNGSDSDEEEVDQLVENVDMVDSCFGETKISEPSDESSSRKSSVEQVVPITDNKENFQMKPVLALQNAAAAAKTPIEKKSLRQLRKMVRELSKKQQPQQGEEKQAAPLQVLADNV